MMKKVSFVRLGNSSVDLAMLQVLQNQNPSWDMTVYEENDVQDMARSYSPQAGALANSLGVDSTAFALLGAWLVLYFCGGLVVSSPDHIVFGGRLDSLPQSFLDDPRLCLLHVGMSPVDFNVYARESKFGPICSCIMYCSSTHHAAVGRCIAQCVQTPDFLGSAKRLAYVLSIPSIKDHSVVYPDTYLAPIITWPGGHHPSQFCSSMADLQLTGLITAQSYAREYTFHLWHVLVATVFLVYMVSTLRDLRRVHALS